MLYKGDCLQEMKKIESGSVDLVLTDLPYNTTDCKWDKNPIDLEALKEQYYRVLKPAGTILLTCQYPFGFKLGAVFFDSFRCRWVWEKDKCANFQALKYYPLKSSEDVLVFNRSGFMQAWNDNSGKEKGTYNPQMRSGKGTRDKRIGKLIEKKGFIAEIKQRDSIKSTHVRKTNDSSKQRFPKDVLYFPLPNRKDRVHPTQKPVSLLKYLILTYSNEGDVVLDSTMGSGSTGVAAANTTREFIGIEQDSKYFDIATKRIQEARQELTLFK